MIPIFSYNLPSLVEIRLHTENQLHRLPGSALKVSVVVGWGGVVVGWWLPLHDVVTPTSYWVEVGL